MRKEYSTSKEVMGVKELSEYLGIAESTVYKWVEYREISFTKVGTLLRKVSKDKIVRRRLTRELVEVLRELLLKRIGA